MKLVLTAADAEALARCAQALDPLLDTHGLALLAAADGLRVVGHAPQADADLRIAVAGACARERVDHAWLADGARLADYRVLALDMDSTLIAIECIDEIGRVAGKGAEIAAITEAAMRGEIADYAESLRRRVALLAGLPVEALQQVLEERLRLNPGAEQLLQAARAAGLTTLLVSGGFTWFTEVLQRRLGIDVVHANTLEIEHGRLTGRVLGPIVDGAAKRARLLALCEELGVAPQRAIAIGDGANDLPMLGAAGLSVAYHAKPVVQAAASCAIEFGGLDVLLAYLA